VNATGERGMFVPRLEREHAQANALVQHVADYPEYPSERHPMEALARLLEEMGVRDPIGSDVDGYPWVLGYRGPTLTELTGTAPAPATADRSAGTPRSRTRSRTTSSSTKATSS